MWCPAWNAGIKQLVQWYDSYYTTMYHFRSSPQDPWSRGGVGNVICPDNEHGQAGQRSPWTQPYVAVIFWFNDMENLNDSFAVSQMHGLSMLIPASAWDSNDTLCWLIGAESSISRTIQEGNSLLNWSVLEIFNKMPFRSQIGCNLKANTRFIFWWQ